MKFSARIKPGSHIDRSWRQHKRLGGIIAGVKFTLKGRFYVTDELDADQVSLLRHNDSVELEATGTMPMASKATSEPQRQASKATSKAEPSKTSTPTAAVTAAQTPTPDATATEE